MQPAGPRKTIRELIAELAQLEDARRWPVAARPQPGGQERRDAEPFELDPAELARREREVIAELRRHQVGS